MKPKQINIDGVLYDLMVVPLPHPARTPLFTTTDGKPVYDKNELIIWVDKRTFDNGQTKGGRIKNDNYLYFSTAKAANEWIADNKPLYSLNDLLAALPDEASKEGIAANLRAKKK